MTKKAERAARIATDKRAAWMKKVRTLTGHLINERMDFAAAGRAYDADMSADAYAADLAAREPVGQCLHPLKVDAVLKAANRAEAKVATAFETMAAAGWDLEKVAPYPRSSAVNREAYSAAVDAHHFFARLTKNATGCHRPGTPDVREPDVAGVARFVQSYREGAAFQYDMFICKMVSKVGDCVEASIEGSHIWGSSVLTITKTDRTERWYTHQIENVSKLGKYFPQWPSRLLKA